MATSGFSTQLRTNSYLLHTDWQLNPSNRISVRATGYTWAVPFNNVTGSASPTRATDSTRTAYAALATWTWTVSPSIVTISRSRKSRRRKTSVSGIAPGIPRACSSTSSGNRCGI